MNVHSSLRGIGSGLVLFLLAAGTANAAETWTARAEQKGSDGKLRTAPVTISLDRMLTTEERDALLAVFKAGDAAATKKALAAQQAVGYVEGAKGKVPVKFAFPRSTGGGRIVTIVSDQPMVYIGGDAPGAKPKTGYDFGYLLLILDAEGKGTGEAVPAAKLRIREDGALVTEEYSGETVWLKDVARK